MKPLQFLFFTSALLCFSFFSLQVFASEIHIEGNRVVLKNNNGDIIDTDNLPKGKDIKVNENVEINEKGISIGSVTNKDGEMKNVRRKTNLENVTIINNGEAKTYNKKE